MTTTTTSHVGSSLSYASICTHDNPTTHPLACNCETGWVFIIIFFESTNANDDDEPCRLVVVICLHLYPRQPNNPPPRLQLRDRVGFLSSFFSSQRTPTTTTSHVGSLSSSAACLRLHSQSSPSLAAPPHLRMRVGGVI